MKKIYSAFFLFFFLVRATLKKKIAQIADLSLDTAILVSSDTDLIPAVRYLRYKGKKLEYVGFSHAPSLGMQKNVDFSILLTPDDIENFRERKLF